MIGVVLKPQGIRGEIKIKPYAADVSRFSSDPIILENRRIDGRNQREVIPVIDELMSTLQIIQPRLYNAVMGRL